MLCQRCGYPSESKRYCTECGAGLYEMKLERESMAVAAKRKAVVHHHHHHAPTGTANHLVGLLIDQKYQLESKIDDGGMGTVYRARRMLIGDDAAIKVVCADQISDPKAVARFRQELQIAVSFKHPNVAAIYDFGISEEGLIYLVTELVEGETLRHILERHGGMNETSVAEIIWQVCEALDEAHRLGIVHRHMKPENIVVQRTESGANVKIIDFGFAAARELSANSSSQRGAIIGTPQYMSPEHCLGENVDGRSDIYSLGVILYEMLTGFVPFDSPNPSAIVVQQVTQYPPPLRELNPNISFEVESIVLKALEKRCELRPQTARELGRDLVLAVGGQRGVVPSRGPDISSGYFVSSIQTTDETERMIEPLPYDDIDANFDQDANFIDEPEDDGLIGKLRVSMFIVLILLLITVGVWFYLSRSESGRTLPRNNQLGNRAQNMMVNSQLSTVSQNAVTNNTPAPAPTPSNLWEVIGEQTTGVTDIQNVLGPPDQQVAVIKPRGQLALDYREDKFFHDGPSADIRIYGPNQSRVSYTVFVRDDQKDWQRVDQNRRWFPRGVNEHNIGQPDLRRARRLLIINNGRNELKLDAIMAIYKYDTAAQTIPIVR